MKHLLTAVIIISTLCLLAIPVFGTNISAAQYLTKILVSNNTTNSYTNVIVPVTCNTSAMIDAAMMSASATDIVLQNDAGQDVAVMPGNPGQPMLLFTDNISPLKQQYKFLYSKGVASDKVAYFPDTAGMYIIDSPSMELSNYFTIYIPVIRFRFDNIGGIIFEKSDGTNGVTCNITGSSNVTAAIKVGGVITVSVTANGITDVDHSFMLDCDGFYLKIYIDGVLKEYMALPSL